MRSWLIALLFLIPGFECASAAENLCGEDDCFAIRAGEIVAPEPQGQNSKYPIVVLVPGCTGFDGSGLDKSLLEKTELAKQTKEIKDHFADFIQLFKNGTFPETGQRFGVLKVDYVTRYKVSCTSVAIDQEVRREIPGKIAELVLRLLDSARKEPKGKALNFEKIYLIGWSLGGIGVLHTRSRLQDWTQYGISKPKTIIAYYPFCFIGDNDGWKIDSSLPTLIFIPLDDDIPDPTQLAQKLPDTCKAQIGINAVSAQGSISIKKQGDIDAVLIPQAKHSFDVRNAKCAESVKKLFCTGEHNEVARQKARLLLGKHIADHK
jgi:dienelactone hydrolase